MSCVLELDPNPGCHTQNHMVHLFLWPRTWWDSAYQNRPPATHSHSVEKMENVASMPSLNRGSSVHIPWGQGAGQSHSQQGDIKLTGAFSLDIYFLENLQNWLRSPPCVDLEPGWHSLHKQKCPIIISEIKQVPFSLCPNMGWIFFLIKTWFNYFTLVESQGKLVCCNKNHSDRSSAVVCGTKWTLSGRSYIPF